MLLEIHLLGAPRFEQEGERLYLSRRKSIAMLAYLAATRQPYSREALAALLWPEFEQSAARANLRRDLSWLRRMLPEDILLVDRLQVDLNPEAEVWVDVHSFEATITAVQQHAHPPDDLCDKCAQTLAKAVSLYEADFMAGFSLADSEQFEEWQFFQREEYRQKMVRMLRQLIGWSQEQQQFEQGIEYGRRWLALDPWHEPAHRALMTFYALTEQQAAALRQYDECVQLLEEELGIEPEPETTALYEAIRNREFERGAKGDRKKGVVNRVEDRLPPSPDASQLPISPTPFIGREQELQTIMSLLREPETRLVTLAGSGGMGKTRLAVAMGNAVIGSFPHGVYFVPLAPLGSADHIPTALAHSLQLSLSGDDPKAQLLAYMHTKQMLLIMDNFEHLLASSHSADAEKEAVGEKLIAEILQSAPQVKVLVTTRERLNLTGETVLPLGGLPVDSSEMAKTSSAAQLFWQHVQLVRPNLVLQPGDEKHINHICRLVAGMPLALILAASWAEMLSLAEIAAEIERDLDFLETDMADLPERQRSVRAVFDASWRRLSAEEQAVFAQLSVFRGGFTRQAAQAVTGASLRTLRGLVHKLLTTLEANGRYQIHELLRQYGAEQLTAVHRHRTAKEAHAAYYLDLLEQREVDLRGRNQLAALNEIDADLENIRLAWDYALAQGDEAAIMQALEGLHLFIDAKGRYIEGIPLLEQAQQQLVPNGDQTLNPTWGRLTARARFMRWTSAGYYEGLEAIIEKCLEIAQKANDRFEIAFCLYFQTVHLFAVKHEPENSLEQLHQALTIFRNIDDHIFTARSLAVLGVIHLHLGEPSQSRARLEEALALARTNGAVIDTSYTLSNLCEIVLSLGDYGAGEDYIREALTLTRQLKQRVGNSYANVLLGLWLLLKGEVDRAEEHIQEGWREAELLNFAVTLTYAPALLALCQALPGDYQRAQQLAEKSLVNPMNDRLGHILAHWALAVVYTGLGDVTLAWDYVRQTVEHIKHYPSVAMLTWVLPVVAVLHAQNEQWETAVHHLALAYTHPLSPTGYLDKWSLLKQTQTRLQAKLGEAAYQSAWAQGQKLDPEALFGDEQ